ncbi:uncharacterized protein ATNIH1004_000998 [Aspergillus tanneri]|uniref:FluG domain-containing protein n=1 Tax=Aspergillus tanneri TaxID=1220188 RepID=A0A5M9N3F3_9EURO|nr:uncharacterized protein ATNIH1004_000998 [Aspergillus tanneri]KAA8652094.1 hypothetical protein ATNIH1004_000998 [Aspergillus tanneri]
MAFSGLPRSKTKRQEKNQGRKSYAYYAERRKKHLANGLTLPQYAPRTNVLAASVRGKWNRFCSEAHLDPDALLQNLTSADVKAWFDWIKETFQGSIKAHGALSTYWRMLKRLYFMKNSKTMGELMEKDCINYMNIVSKEMGLRKLPLPKPTEQSVDLLHFQTTHLVHCNAVFADEKQRLYHMAGLNLSSVTACRSVSLFDTRCPVNIQPDGNPVLSTEGNPADDESLLLPSSSQDQGPLIDSGYESNQSNDSCERDKDTSDEMSSDSSDLESDIDCMSDCSSVTDDGYLAGDDNTGTILWRHIDFCIVRNPVPGRPNILAAIVTLLHTKGEDRKPRIFVIEHEDNLIFDLLSQLLAMAWHDCIFAADHRDVEDIYTFPIPSHRRGMKLKIKSEWLDRPVFREPEHTLNGYRTSDSQPLKSQTWSRNLKRTGEKSGEEQNLTQKVLRRGGINAINDKAPASVRDQVADHESNAVKYYLNEVVNFDTAAAFHQRPSNEAVQREFRSATLLADNTAPLSLTDQQKRRIARDPQVRRLRKVCRGLTQAIRQSKYRTVKGAKGTKIGEEKRQADAELHSKLTELRQKAKENNRRRHFRNTDTTLFNQRYANGAQSKESEAQHRSLHCYEIPERAELVDLLFYTPPAKTEEEAFFRRLRYIRLMVRWQGRKEAPRRGRQAAVAAVPQPHPSRASPENTVPEKYDPLQCPFCLADQSLPPAHREKKKSKINKLWDHVENLHRAELAAFVTGTRRCGLCGLRNVDFVPCSVPNFKNHTQTVHGIRLRT